MGFYQTVENALKGRQFAYLKHLEFYYGQEVQIYKMRKDEYERVYGRSSGSLDGTFFNLICIVVNSDVIPVGPASAGTFTTGALYSSQTDEIEIGQVVSINSGDGRTRRFTVTQKQSYGVTTDVFHRYEIQSIGD